MVTVEALPPIIQGGMGVQVSSWQLAAAVARCGQLGVVSGTALDLALARRLQDGDPGGHYRQALAHFPDQAMAGRTLARHFLPSGRPTGTPYRPVPRLVLHPQPASVELAVLGAFAEVWLARDGHGGLVGINLLEKIQMAVPTAAFGAMLAGVDVVLVGAGVPRGLPALLDDLAAGRPAEYAVDVHGADENAHAVTLDPAAVLGVPLPALRRPVFLAIVSSHVLATYLARDPAIRPDGFVVEASPAGGHNAPPRRPELDADGNVLFGPRDEPDSARIAALGLPFWMAGATGTPEGLAAARAAGARGIQAGTVFALAEESGLRGDLRVRLRAGLADNAVTVRTSATASPTGFPFKVVDLPGTITDPRVYASRARQCDLGFLRSPFQKDDGSVGYRCPAEAERTYLLKGGRAEDTEGRVCLCNGLSATVGMGQHRRDGYDEPALLTLGADLDGPTRLNAAFPHGWTAADVVAWLERAPVPA
ncbi:MAG: beta/alpha barrel domain-containing protein [Candidatus Nanopelagicales bacterium]